MTRPSRRRVVRNLRAAPAFLTAARVDRLIGMLDALRAPRAEAPVAAEPMPIAAPKPVCKPKRAPARPAPVADKMLAEAVAPIAAVAAESVEPSVIVRSEINPAADRVELSNAVRIRAAVEHAAKTRAASEAERNRAHQAALKISAASTSSQPVIRTLGVQNAAPAIAWLRSHGVSVKASSTTVFGTKYIASNEFGELDVAAIVALARKKGFAG